LGYSHPIITDAAGVTVATPTPTEIVLTGVDKQVLVKFAAQIRAYRAPSHTKARVFAMLMKLLRLKKPREIRLKK